MISVELLKGSLTVITLKLIAFNGRTYGYDIIKSVEKMTSGRIKLTIGTIYPVLHRLKKDGLVNTEEVKFMKRTRIYYKLTQKGNKIMAEKIKELDEYIEVMGLLSRLKEPLELS
jgi:PadR family transcriptional regulator, regulatory protein PadR